MKQVSVYYPLPGSSSFLLKTVESKSAAPPSVFTEETRMSGTS